MVAQALAAVAQALVVVAAALAVVVVVISSHSKVASKCSMAGHTNRHLLRPTMLPFCKVLALPPMVLHSWSSLYIIAASCAASCLPERRPYCCQQFVSTLGKICLHLILGLPYHTVHKSHQTQSLALLLCPNAQLSNAQHKWETLSLFTCSPSMHHDAMQSSFSCVKTEIIEHRAGLLVRVSR